MTTFSRWVTAFALVFAAIASNAYATAINVLWYSYADAASEYKSFYTALATTGSPQSTGLTWNLTFYGPGDPTPNFSDYNVLVIESGEAFRTGPPGLPNATPDYSGILTNKPAIEAARGNRTLISGADADFHAVRGDSGLCGSGSYCYDGALGYVINSVNWAASGANLGIVSFVDGNFPGSFWWDNPDSFLLSELHGYVSSFKENNAIIDPVEATYQLNQGLTSAGLSNWTYSFHAGFLKTIPGYTATVDSSSYALYALSIASATVAPVTYTLTYTAGANGSITGNSPQTVSPGSNGSAVTAVPNAGYHFVNWSDVSTANPRTDTNVTANVTVTANFAINTYRVTYNGNTNTGGSVPVDGNTYAPGATVTVLGNTGSLVKTGYTFAGWNTAANGSGTPYAGGATFAMGSANVTLYAQWTGKTFTVTYNGHTNTGGSVPVDGNTYAPGATVTVLGNTGSLVKTGYTFAGWNTKPSGKGTSYIGGATFAMGSANVTLYAQWIR